MLLRKEIKGWVTNNFYSIRATKLKLLEESKALENIEGQRVFYLEDGKVKELVLRV